MKYLIFGDVHGNLPALEMLFKNEHDNFDEAICHGDVVNYGPWSNECVQFLSSLPNLKKLQGNHEKNYLSGTYDGTNLVARTFFSFCFPNFQEFEEIKRYEEFVEVKEFRVQHTVDNKYVFPDTDLSTIELEQNYIIGHSHYQFDRFTEGKRLINTGSIGQNRKLLDVAEYITYDASKNKIELKSFNFNISTVIKEMEKEGYPEICLNYYKNKKRMV